MRINKIFKSHMNDIECFHSTEVAKIVYLMVKQFEGVSMHPVSYHNNHKWTSFVWIAVICPQEGCLFATLLEVLYIYLCSFGFKYTTTLYLIGRWRYVDLLSRGTPSSWASATGSRPLSVPQKWTSVVAGQVTRSQNCIFKARSCICNTILSL